MGIVSFALGFLSGWFVRSSVDSSRELAVDVARHSQSMIDRLRRKLLAEQEFLEDLWAEAHADDKAPPPEPGPLSARGGHEERVPPSIDRREPSRIEAPT